MPDEKPVCPRCGSELTVSVANQRHCNSCGHEFDLERDPVGKRARDPERRGLWLRKVSP